MWKVKLCKDCWKPRDHENPLYSRCKACQYGRNQVVRVPINQIGRKRKERIQKEGTEVKIFRERFLQLERQGANYCMVTGKLVTREHIDRQGDFSLACFPHIIPKSKEKAFRLLKNNIGLVWSVKEHAIFDEKVRAYKEKIGYEELKKKIASGEEIYFYL